MPRAREQNDEEAPEAPTGTATAFRIVLPSFEGPLDLLLHLIREHKVDILDIPISLITEKYLETLKTMRELDLDIAGEFLLMAATLTHIKSRLLLPNPEPLAEDAEEQGDPREELVRRLLTYQKYRAAAEELGQQDLLGRVVFIRQAVPPPVPLAEGEMGLVEVSVFKLIDALDRALKNAKVKIPHEVFLDRVSIGDAIARLVESLKAAPRVSFFAVLEGAATRQRIVVTFLALLEMCKLGLTRVMQEESTGDIVVFARNSDALRSPADVEDGYA